MNNYYWIHANIDGRKKWHMVCDKNPGMLFIDEDFEEDEYDIETYREDFPDNQVIGPIRPPASCTCDENCDEPCRACNTLAGTAARIAYRMSRKDALRYAAKITGEAHTDQNTAERMAKMIHSLAEGDSILFEDLSKTNQTKLKMIAQEMISSVGAVLLRALKEAPETIDFEAVARAAEQS